MRRFAILSVTTIVFACFDEARAVDFAQDVQPIFAEHCLACHGADSAEGGLRLDQAIYALGSTESGEAAIVPNEPAASTLLKRVQALDDDHRMPPEGAPLSRKEIATLTRWIDEGANWTEHWAYRPIEVGTVPVVSNVEWCHSPIDRFVLAKLETLKISPSEPASRAKLIRRLSYDLLGLPPNPDEVDEFVRDATPDAYERLVDRMLASPRFGERWGRHWLDKARYADSDGYEKDNNRPNAWRYRDWVINAINEDKPYDQFTVEQIAGDLLPTPTDDQRLATAFHRQTLTNTEGGTDKEQWRVAAVMDRTETIGTVWLGLTVGCARCHNHKYDQISQSEYYQLYAFFNNADEVNHELPPTAEQLNKFESETASHESKLAAKRQQLAELDAGDSSGCDEKKSESAKATNTGESSERNDRRKQLTEEIAKLAKSKPRRPTFRVRVIKERNKDLRTTNILRRGEFKEPLDEVSANTFASLPPMDDALEPERLRFARWLVDGDNPLVPRVAVNHIWQKLFGTGLVATPNDFGVRGELPSHPRLLDHLAASFVDLGWSRKTLIRNIVLSATYRQTSAHRPELVDVDPKNRLLYRQNRFRLEAESLRDITLAAANLLSQRIGGPSVFPPMPADAAAISYANNFKWKTSDGENRYRRGLYTFFKRTAPHPTLMTFDCPDANVTNVQRNRSNTPIGALALLNNEVYSQASSALAAELLRDRESAKANEASDAIMIREAFKRCVTRNPKKQEVATVAKMLRTAREIYRNNRAAASAVVGKSRTVEVDVAEQAAWAATARVVLNLDEFITRD